MAFRRSVPFAVALFAACAIIIIFLRRKVKKISPSTQRFRLNFIPANYISCEDITPNISMSRLYERLKVEFELAAQNAIQGEITEGHSAQIDAQYKTIHYVTRKRHVRTVCETGFNLGHSSFNYLTANKRLVVHSFDLGKYRFAWRMSAYLKRKFPNRFFIHFGDSRETIPIFMGENPGLQCDFILVDGGHAYSEAMSDLRNLAMIANLQGNLIMLDDYPTNWGASFGRSWDEMIQAGIIKEIMRCTCAYDDGTQRGFTIGRVVKKPYQRNSTK